MTRGSLTTRWIIAGAAAVVVVAASVIVVVLTLRSDPPTSSVGTTTAPSTMPTTTAVPTTDDSGTTTTEPADVDETDVPIEVGDRDRRYLLIEPRRLTPTEQVPVIVVLHGLGVSAGGISYAADWRQAVEEERFIAVFPQGVENSWNMGPCCLPANLLGVDDQGFLNAVMAELQARPEVDQDRLYLTGFSNGGIMAYAYACAQPGLFAALAPMAGSNLAGCFPDEPISLLHQHSDPDPVVPYNGGVALGSLITASSFPDVPRTVASWAEESGCDPEPASRIDEDDVEHFTWEGCPGGIEVRLNRIPGAGHAWPTKGDYDPLAVLLDFFDVS